MRRFLIGLVAISTMGMGGKKPEVPDPSLPSPEAYQVSFKSVGTAYGASFTHQSASFSFRSFIGFAIGMCTYSSARAAVALSKSAWSRGSATFREMLVFHELGHCLLGRGHMNSNHSSGRKESLMASVIFDERTYLANRDQYMKELFTAESHAVQHAMASESERDFNGCNFGK